MRILISIKTKILDFILALFYPKSLEQKYTQKLQEMEVVLEAMKATVPANHVNELLMLKESFQTLSGSTFFMIENNIDMIKKIEKAFPNMRGEFTSLEGAIEFLIQKVKDSGTKI